LGDRFGGTYVPSAGTIYPRLAKLEEEGLVSKAVDGRKTVYSITEAGRAELAERAGELDGIEDELSDSVRRLADEVRTSVNSAMKTLRADLASAALDARRDARVSGSTTERDEASARVDSRVNLQQADALLQNFRHQVRSELRSRVVAGDVTAETVEVLRAGLDEVRTAVAESLRNSGRPENTK